jgi:RNA polymerase sigma-70 factor, ECF subfamily
VADSGHPLTSAASCPGASGSSPREAALGAASAGGPGDFASFFETHRDALHRFLWRLTGNSADADDLLQETFLVVWRKRAQYEGRGSAEGWLRRTAFRLFLNQRTKSKRRADLADARNLARDGCVAPDESSVDDREATAFLVRRIESAVAELPDEPRIAFVLFRFEGLTCAQIAEATEVPAKTVETRLRRATELLAQKVAKYRDHLPGSASR